MEALEYPSFLLTQIHLTQTKLLQEIKSFENLLSQLLGHVATVGVLEQREKCLDSPQKKHWCAKTHKYQATVDGGNPAPIDK